MSELAQRAEFLRRCFLFDKLKEEPFNLIVQKVQERAYQRGEVIVRQGNQDDRFFMIFSGSVNVERKKRRGGRFLEKRTAGDYFGEEVFVKHRPSDVTAVAAEATILLVFRRVDFERLLKKNRQVKSNFDAALASHRLAGKLQFKWLREGSGEVIYFLTRKHPVVLLQMLLIPFCLAIIAFMGLSAGMLVQFMWLLWPSVIGLGLCIGWGIWKAVDWRNDYYVVTNQRVVRLEKKVGIYDSRREVPLSATQRISVQMPFWGQQLDCGTLVVRTIVGSTLTLRDANHPGLAAAIIDEHWKRLKESQARAEGSFKLEEDAMRQVLQERLSRRQPEPAPVPSLVESPVQEEPESPRKKRGLANIFQLRLEDVSTITYRKHWIVLLQRTWFPNLLFIGLIAWLVREITHGLDILMVVWFLVLLLAFVWWYYLYMDWSNDVFQVTPDQIIDISKKPLGEVTSDIASLDNILNLEYKRRGLLQILFNYGNVNITIGGGKEMVFVNVFDPSTVQADIERRRLERTAQKEQENIQAERERMADWLAAYHRNSQELYPPEEDEGMEEVG